MLEVIPGKVFVIGVSALIAFLAITTQAFVLVPYLQATDNLVALWPLNLGLLLIFYNYYLACTTDPGQTPKDWEPPTSLLESVDASQQGVTGPRFCKHCDAFKPPRAHHCKSCKRCILRMDHHCPWVNNCVGHGNYGHFIRFVFYVDLTCTYALVLVFMRIFNNTLPQLTLATTIMTIIDAAGVLIVLLSVGILSLFHIYCLIRGQTTIESSERSKVKRLVRRKKIAPVDYPFDLSIYSNICAVLGNNPCLWMYPQKSRGDGLSYPVRPGTAPWLPYYWPPRDPEELGQVAYQPPAEEENYPLVRRDSEGYLVREITMEERMQMLDPQSYEEPLIPEGLLPDMDEDQHNPVGHVYFYDSGSLASGSEPEYSPSEDENQ